MTRTVVLDCDNAFGLMGRDIDDGLALLYLLGTPGVRLAGVTTTFGNAALPGVIDATQRLLGRVGRGDGPVLAGAARAGDHRTRAAAWLAETVAARPGEITVIATGPLGNVAGAAALDPGFFGNVREIICMGGRFRPLRYGWRPLGELNFSADAAAARTVLAAPCPVTLVPTEACNATFRARDLPALAGVAPGVRRAIAAWLACFGLPRGVERFVLWDLLPALWATRPRLFRDDAVPLAARQDRLDAGLLAPGTGSPVRCLTGLKRPDAALAAILPAWRRAAPAPARAGAFDALPQPAVT